MTPNIVQIDRGRVDNEILDYKSQIDRLESELDEAKRALEVRQEMIKYIDSITVNGSSKKPESDTTPKQNIGVSDFIMSFIGIGERDTKEIITAYAEKTNSTYEKVSGNVSNALSRLKTAKKIDNKLKAGGRKAGSYWFTIN